MGDGDERAAQRLAALFAGSNRGYGTHGAPVQQPGGVKWEIKGTARTLRGTVTMDHWLAHLRGETPLGVIPIREDSKCLWGSIDVDEYDVNPREVIQRSESAGLPLVPCRSKSSGLHLFMFLQEWTAAEVLNPLLKHLAASLGLSSKTEIFPKQFTVLGENDLGNWITMPYLGTDYDGKIRMQVGLKKTGAEMTIGEFLSHAETSKVAPERIAALRATRVRSSGSAGARVGDAGGAPFSDGPPCLQHLVAGQLLGDGRKRALFHMAVYYKRAQPDTWKEATERANQDHMTPPLPSEEVGGIIKSLSKKDYNYKCRESPMADHCDSLTCRSRRYGVGEGSAIPAIAGLSKLDTEPPIWFVDIDGGRVEATTEQLQRYDQFHRLCMEKLNVCFGGVKQADWLAMVSPAMANVVLVEAPPEVGASGRFLEMLEDFLTNRAAGERIEDLLSGRPWHDAEGEKAPGAGARHYFRLRDLQAHLTREQAPREMTRGWITQRVKALGGGSHFFNLKGKGCATWWVPAAAVEPVPELDLPKSKGTPI